MLENWQGAAPHAASSLFAVAAASWASVAGGKVPQPYLDEFFHVPQAQKYCKGDFSWDPKITTPPGLYLIAKLFQPIVGCSTKVLRFQNVLAIVLVFHTVLHILRLVRERVDPQRPTKESLKLTNEENIKNGLSVNLDGKMPVSNALSAVNISLLPPLFFFAALYYTDVMSTAAVLLSYQIFLHKRSPAGDIRNDVSTVFVGIVALFFRQTNIFWVAVFPAGLTVVQVLERNEPWMQMKEKKPTSILQECWKTNTVYDGSVYDAGLRDVIMFVLTIVPAALRKPIVVLRSIASYVVLLVIFAGFVAWNGSVVLGDKSAHTATIHIPQMLYIWPYIALFSAPILLGPLYRIVGPFMPPQLKKMLGYTPPKNGPSLPELLPATLFIAGGLAAVHFNTIVHPYTLADNRHYVFYIFRILLRHPAVKYIAVPVYYVCAYLSIQALGSLPVQPENTKPESKNLRTDPPTKPKPCQVSFVLVWLVATALSVVTAPLVEPRYFIIPWIVWRLHVPYLPVSFTVRGKQYSQDLRLVAETIWLLAINQVVQHLFLYRTFTWPSEPGKIQRFLW
ncbi:Dolichyl-P-Glc:Glc(2)Man(9)GlcNAc(2)-PP-dolichol alpha-1,2glucosyltransferase [Ascochyta rabiei]|uniref:Dol-P-Glc:Glc(2)Man(9)GlcNAc(2)-PP-Dol alpha-1,2-glucosyltransferase n=1 Tax=Didymella rabiei TaxID=5454 RepID=A0A163GY73_DIDRA|nr:Dolichyl-P-Glc:Glc(2)Man(9)GlcNAc(2)-PP-dolichol alpha-1,2glucosyltransferase [Ascochyta rabiei]KZM25064.1 transferase [Ascochyta rabiei]UPX17177.1 Dolichyl-P-Glc:Glc(2)Man(9)GlcNAc(2)-PP-dolichol alpha-1,2glucosyltransferase [Ascochyta rabiei]